MAASVIPTYFYTGPIREGLSSDVLALFTEYSDIPVEDLEEHIHAIRDRAWKIYPYPCIGLFAFLRLDLAHHPAYPKVLELLRPADADDKARQDQPRFLDLACCVGQNIRKLAFDGIPASALYGSDLHGEFLELGFDLFKDKGRFPDPEEQFFAGDLFTADSVANGDSNPWSKLAGKFRVINAGNFLHLFDYDTQVRACCILVQLLDPRAGSIFSGSQLGHTEPGEVPRRRELQICAKDGGKYVMKARYLHNPDSFAQLWKDVERLTGTSFHVEAQLNRFNAREEMKVADVTREAMRAAAQGLSRIIGTNELLTFTVSRVRSG